MGFHAVSFGHTKKHGCVFDFLKLLFKDIKVSYMGDNIIVDFYPYNDVLINGKHHDVFKVEKPNECENWEDNDDIIELLTDDTVYGIEYKGTTYHVGSGHCCSYGIVLATVGDDCGGEGDIHFDFDEIQEFYELLKTMYEAGRLGSTKVSMTGNCCS